MDKIIHKLRWFEICNWQDIYLHIFTMSIVAGFVSSTELFTVPVVRQSQRSVFCPGFAVAIFKGGRYRPESHRRQSLDSFRSWTLVKHAVNGWGTNEIWWMLVVTLNGNRFPKNLGISGCCMLKNRIWQGGEKLRGFDLPWGLESSKWCAGGLKGWEAPIHRFDEVAGIVDVW